MQKVNVKLIINKDSIKKNIFETIMDIFKSFSKTYIVADINTTFKVLKQKATSELEMKFKFTNNITPKFELYFGKDQAQNPGEDASIQSLTGIVKNPNDKESVKNFKKKLNDVRLVAILPEGTEALKIQDGAICVKLFTYTNNKFESGIELIAGSNIKELNQKLKEKTKEYNKPVFYTLSGIGSNENEIPVSDIFEKIQAKFEPGKIANKAGISIIAIQSVVEVSVKSPHTEEVKIKINEKTKFRNLKNEFLKKNKVKLLNDQGFSYDDKKAGVKSNNVDVTISNIAKHNILNILRLIPKPELNFTDLIFKFVYADKDASVKIEDTTKIGELTVQNIKSKYQTQSGLTQVNFDIVEGAKKDDDKLINLKKVLKLKLSS